MSVVRHDVSLCIGCETCVNTCPRDVFRMNKDVPNENEGYEDAGKSVIAYPEECQTCGMCYLYCPTGSLAMRPEPYAWPVTGYR